jgi:ribonuclease HI
MPEKKWYVVWKGIEPGVYENWIDCKRQIDGFEGAIYKSFDTQSNAQQAYHATPWEYIGKDKKTKPSHLSISDVFISDSLSVDAACSGNPGRMEYRGVYTATGDEVFHVGPLEQGTNNVGEFLAIVHGLAFLKKQNRNIPVYSDSRNAILWVKQKQCKTKLIPVKANNTIFNLIERAENWLKNNTFENKILKWETHEWGEILADFGRKQHT